MIVFDASAVISAALRETSIPGQALLRAEETDIFAMSDAVDAEIEEVLNRPRFATSISGVRRARILTALRNEAAWFAPSDRVTDCRDAKDNKYLELALAAGADAIISGDADSLVLHPWRGVRILRPADYLAELGSKP